MARNVSTKVPQTETQPQKIATKPKIKKLDLNQAVKADSKRGHRRVNSAYVESEHDSKISNEHREPVNLRKKKHHMLCPEVGLPSMQNYYDNIDEINGFEAELA